MTRLEIINRIEALRKANEDAISARHEEIRELRQALARTTRNIYLASSWRNEFYEGVLGGLRALGHHVYDFRNSYHAFKWDDIDPGWREWSADQYRCALLHPAAQRGYASDMGAMREADTCVLVLPCGRSAHLELGWMAGAGKRTYILTRDGEEPELMAKMATAVVSSLAELYRELEK
jgi:hypothetical protein